MRTVDVFIAIGPLLGISRLVGKERARRLELSILRAGTEVWGATKRIWLLLSLCGVLFGALALLACIELYSEHLVRNPKALELLCLTWSCYGWIWFGRLLYLATRKIAYRVESRLQKPAPWPFCTALHEFCWTAGTILTLDVVLAFFLYGAAFAFTALCYLLFLPLFLAERLRARLAPDSTSYLDVIGYGISLAAAYVKLRA